MTTTDLRVAVPADAVALAALERAANLVGLAHVFGERPFPQEAVLARWREVLGDSEVRVLVLDGAEGLVAYLAHDRARVRHLAVRPASWHRGHARALLAEAVREIRAGGATPLLWVLEENTRARALYERLGWRRTGTQQVCEWSPHPVELEYALDRQERDRA